MLGRALQRRDGMLGRTFWRLHIRGRSEIYFNNCYNMPDGALAWEAIVYKGAYKGKGSSHVKLHLGFDDYGRGYLWGDDREYPGGEQCSAGLGGRSGFPVHYNDGSDGSLGRADGDCTDVWADREAELYRRSHYMAQG